MKRILALALAALLLLALCPAAGLAAGEEDAVQTISSTEEFLAFAEGCALESYSLGRRFSLTADIDLSNSGFAPIPYFAGTLKGNGHVILGLRREFPGFRYNNNPVSGAVRHQPYVGHKAADIINSDG